MQKILINSQRKNKAQKDYLGIENILENIKKSVSCHKKLKILYQGLSSKQKKIVDRFLDQTDTALTDDHYLAEVNAETIQRVKDKIRLLEQKLSSLAN